MTFNNTLNEFYRAKKILVTGHTGFIGSWLSEWIILLNSRLCGYALDPSTVPNLFDALTLKSSMVDIRGDVRDSKLLRKTLREFNPEIVFHLAAQPIVLDSYENPVETFDTNVTGTVNLLNELRHVESVKTIIVMTSDKSYRNNEWVYPYRENDILGGKDPYSASKSCQDIVVDSFRESYFSNSGIGISTVRAGNVIGGGDWASHRIIPDLVRGIVNGEAVKIRNPQSVRPWQHVLEPISGMLTLAEKMYNDINFSGAWNFGPENYREVTVKELVEKFIENWGSGNYVIEDKENFKEANYLQLDISKAKREMRWTPRFDFLEALKFTVDWYKEYYRNQKTIGKKTNEQINDYFMAGS
ncbi:MAG: CDP-glucose 4,6-dehydratase [Candidatus Thermoplasmatota archaeon]|nr:CDP-glucose 4,6-dehydratase [Candidatus Thermoplasmatota archaeon]